MPTRKLDETSPAQPNVCFDRDHNPPNMQVFEPGLYEHECPSCGQTVIFRVHGWRLTPASENR